MVVVVNRWSGDVVDFWVVLCRSKAENRITAPFVGNFQGSKRFFEGSRLNCEGYELVFEVSRILFGTSVFDFSCAVICILVFLHRQACR